MWTLPLYHVLDLSDGLLEGLHARYGRRTTWNWEYDTHFGVSAVSGIYLLATQLGTISCQASGQGTRIDSKQRRQKRGVNQKGLENEARQE